MSIRLGLIIAAVLLAMTAGTYVIPGQADDDREYARGNCVEGQKCG